MRRHGGLRLSYRLVLLAALAALDCGDGDRTAAGASRPILVLDTAVIRVASATDTSRLRVELAVTDEQQRLGLMARPSLAPDAGMLFLYPTAQPESAVFWMFRTLIPLDIAYIDSAGIIRAIVLMTPCDSTYAAACPAYPAGVRYRAALEVNQGYFTRHGLQVGDRVLLEDTSHTATAGRAAGRS